MFPELNQQKPAESMSCSKPYFQGNRRFDARPLPPITLNYPQFIQQYKGLTECALTDELKLYRSQVYMINLRKINAHNADPSRKYNMGLNQFTDLMEEEFLRDYARLSIP